MNTITTTGKTVAQILDEVDAQRAALGGSRYETVSTLAKAVKPDGFDTLGRALVTIDGKQRAIPVARNASKEAASYDVVLEVAKEDFNWVDNAKNIRTVAAGTHRYQLITATA